MGTMVAHSAGALPSALSRGFPPTMAHASKPAAALPSVPAVASRPTAAPATSAYPADTFYGFDVKPASGPTKKNLQFYLLRYRVPADMPFEKLWMQASGRYFYRLWESNALPREDIPRLAMATLRFACAQRGDTTCRLLEFSPMSLFNKILIHFDPNNPSGRISAVQHGMVFMGKVRYDPPPAILAAMPLVSLDQEVARAARLTAPPGAPPPPRGLTRRDRRHQPPRGAAPRPWMLSRLQAGKPAPAAKPPHVD